MTIFLLISQSYFELYLFCEKIWQRVRLGASTFFFFSSIVRYFSAIWTFCVHDVIGHVQHFFSFFNRSHYFIIVSKSEKNEQFIRFSMVKSLCEIIALNYLREIRKDVDRVYSRSFRFYSHDVWTYIFISSNILLRGSNFQKNTCEIL